MPHKWIVLFTHSDWLTWRWLASTVHLRTAGLRDFTTSDRLSQKITFWCANYSACVVYTETIIHLNVSESDGYLSQYFAARKRSTTIHLRLVNNSWIHVLSKNFQEFFFIRYYYFRSSLSSSQLVCAEWGLWSCMTICMTYCVNSRWKCSCLLILTFCSQVHISLLRLE